jgi:hypothetical protein
LPFDPDHRRASGSAGVPLTARPKDNSQYRYLLGTVLLWLAHLSMNIQGDLRVN